MISRTPPVISRMPPVILRTVRSSFSGAQLILNLSGLDAKETKVMVQQIVSNISSRNCPYCHDFIANACTSSQMIVGEQLLKDLREWLTPPDPSTNHTIACDAQHERTAAWVFKEDVFKEWESSGSLLWIHGKGTTLYTSSGVHLADYSCFRSGLGKEHPLVWHLIVSYSGAYALDQLCNYPAYHRPVPCWDSLHRLFLF